MFDDAYVRRLREGDRDTEEHFYKHFRARLSAMLWQRLRSPEAREDVIQETFARVLMRLHDLRDPAKLGGFVAGVCNHVLQEEYRVKRTESIDKLLEELADRTDNEEQVIRAEAIARVRRVIARMEKRDADILRALYLDEEEKDEVCRKHGVDRQYLRVLVHRARERFRAEWARKSNPHFTPETFLLELSLSL
jgi:RNA polymerase sigma-70 factor, ECF subfamily